MAEKMIAYCGLTCTDCPGYHATRAGDRQLAQQTAALWSQEFGAEFSAADVWCDGCRADGRQSSHCALCKIRQCALELGHETCAHCPDYICETLRDLLAAAPGARQTLSDIRGTVTTLG